MRPGDTVEHIKTGKRATVVGVDVLWLRLDTERGVVNDLGRYWRKV